MARGGLGGLMEYMKERVFYHLNHFNLAFLGICINLKGCPMKNGGWAPPENLWVDESEGWAPFYVDADSEKCQIQMTKNLVHSFNYILYQPTPSHNFSGTDGIYCGQYRKKVNA